MSELRPAAAPATLLPHLDLADTSPSATGLPPDAFHRIIRQAERLFRGATASVVYMHDGVLVSHGGAWIEELRRYSNPELSPAKLQATLAKYEADHAKLVQQQAEREKDELTAEKVRQKFESRIKEMDQRIERAKTELAESRTRKPIDLNRAMEEVFLRTVSRPPTPAELKQAQADVAAAKDPVDGIRELLWTMLNTREFMVNH